jgi:hypothetical protein
MLAQENEGRPDEVFLLGCSRSMLELTAEEVGYINRARCVLALNKFVLYHDVVGIVPTHVWFTEVHHPGPEILRHILRYCRRVGLDRITFVVLPRGTFQPRPIAYWKDVLIRKARGLHTWQIYRIPRRSGVEFVTLNHYLEGGDWAVSLDQPLFHLRTSFTCALNYLAIQYPGTTIKLVGTDFNTHGYFFDEQISRHKIDFSDWTTPIQDEHKRHFAAVEHGGSTVFDAFPVIKENVHANNCRLVCNNPGSEVVRRGLASFEPIIPGSSRRGIGYRPRALKVD